VAIGYMDKWEIGKSWTYVTMWTKWPRRFFCGSYLESINKRHRVSCNIYLFIISWICILRERLNGAFHGHIKVSVSLRSWRQKFQKFKNPSFWGIHGLQWARVRTYAGWMRKEWVQWIKSWIPECELVPGY